MSPEPQPSSPPIRERLSPLPPPAAIQRRQQRNTRSRRAAALWLGFAMGAGYFSITQLINPLFLPGLPVYQTPPGMPWTALIAGLACMLVALVTAWPESATLGILFGGLLGTLVFDSYAVVNTLSDRVPLALLSSILILILLPMAAMTAVFIGVFRWSLDRQQSAWQDQRSALIAVTIPLILILTASGFGATALYPQLGRQVLTRMNQLILSGQAASQPEIPPELAVDGVKNFKANALGAYTLEWSKDPTNRYAIPRYANSGGKESIGIARFQNNYLLICLYTNPEAEPECVSRTTSP